MKRVSPDDLLPLGAVAGKPGKAGRSALARCVTHSVGRSVGRCRGEDCQHHRLSRRAGRVASIEPAKGSDQLDVVGLHGLSLVALAEITMQEVSARHAVGIPLTGR